MTPDELFEGQDVNHPEHGRGRVHRAHGAMASVDFGTGRAPVKTADLVALTQRAKPRVTDGPRRGQLRMSYRLAERYTGRLLHVTGLGWHSWDGARWSPHDGEKSAQRAVHDLLLASRHEAADLDGDDRKALLADAARCETRAGVTGVLGEAAAIQALSATVDELDADPYLLNTPTGTLDLQTGQLRPHDPADRITKITGAGYDADAAGEAWPRFLAEILPDDQVREFTQRLAGLALVGKVVEHVLPIFIGTGANGKGTFTRTLQAALGDYAIEAEPDLLLERDRAHTTGLTDLRGTRLAVMQETDDGRRLAVATVKRLTGGDTIRARKMYRDFLEFTPSHTAVLVSNHLPRVPADDQALWRRLRVVPFDYKIPNPDATVEDQLRLDLVAVLAWAVRGYQAYALDGLAEPPQVLAATDRYRTSSDALARFLDERCTIGEDERVRKRELWNEWSRWCHVAGEQAGTERSFADAIEQRGFASWRSNGLRMFKGLSLAPDEDAQALAFDHGGRDA